MARAARFIAIAGVAGAAVALPSTAWGADAEGCSGSFTSLDTAGDPIDAATAPGDGATEQDPFVIDPAGSVDWDGSTDAVIKNGTWSVTAGGVQILSGTFENALDETGNQGNQSLSDLPLPADWVFDTSMVIPVSGTITGEGGASCTASGWITGTGNPTASPLFIAGGALAVGGLAAGIGVFAGTRIVPTGGGMA